MLLQEIAGQVPADLEGWLSVPDGALWPEEVKGCWVFSSGREAASAASSERAHRLLAPDRYLPYYKTGNGVYIVLLVTRNGFDHLSMASHKIFAFGVTEKSCREAGVKAWRASSPEGELEPDVFRVPNFDAAFFDEDEE